MFLIKSRPCFVFVWLMTFEFPGEKEKTDATSTVVVIKDIILQLVLDRKKLQGQCHDAYSTMMGKKKGI